MTLVKICGITNLADALVSVRFGADMLGFNFYQKSARYIEPSRALEIAHHLPDSLKKVGVFVNESIETITKIATFAGLDAAQLHGEENLEEIGRLRAASGMEIIKSFRVGSDYDVRDVMKCEPQVDAVLLDGPAGIERGGAGKTFDWEKGWEVSTFAHVLYLAGGLNPGNVADAVRRVRPYAVDVASGVESSPGKKDPNKVAAFIKAAKEAI